MYWQCQQATKELSKTNQCSGIDIKKLFFKIAHHLSHGSFYFGGMITMLKIKVGHNCNQNVAKQY